MTSQPTATATTPRATAITSRPLEPTRYTRYVNLDVLRALALVGVFIVNIGFLTFTIDGPVSTAVMNAENLLLHDKSRTLLSLLFGASAALMWARGATRTLLWRRYAVLFAVFGVVNLLFFPADILTHYALIGALFVIALPWLMSGSRARPLCVAAGFAGLEILTRTIAPPVLEFGGALLTDSSSLWTARAVIAANQLWTGLVLQGPWTAAAFAVGIWLTRRLIHTGSAAPGSTSQRRSLLLAAGGIAVAALGHIAQSRLTFTGNEAAAGMPPLSTAAWLAAGFGGALAYVGLISLLIERNGTAARLLTQLAPLGRLTLTAYLTSTFVFVLILYTGPADGLPLAGGLALMTALWIAFAVLAPIWFRSHRYGPAEWLWRTLSAGRNPDDSHRSGRSVAE
ncbi:DUF418 domain-containing protein [Nocardia sp. NPDC127526]|uniref:DUF418 domain-containing protein n=1 Tax=Nocardia sp. NPDC127526 TaxID=3345393 RepID=UPI003644F544